MKIYKKMSDLLMFHSHDLTDQLPTEMLLEIFSFLHSKFRLLTLSLVCKKWKFLSLTKTKFNVEFKGAKSSTFINNALFEIDRQQLLVDKLEFGENPVSQATLEIVENLRTSLQYLKCLVPIDELRFIINQFSNLKSLDIRRSKLSDNSICHELMNSKLSLPNLVELKIENEFNNAKTGDHSIKAQLVSLTIDGPKTYGRMFKIRKPVVANLEYPNLKKLELIDVVIESRTLPIGLKSLALIGCDVNFIEFERVSESLEKLEINLVTTDDVNFLQKSNLKNLKKLKITNQDLTFWEKLEKVYQDEWKAFTLTSFTFDRNYSKTVKKLCNLDLLTSLDISNGKISSNDVIDLLNECEMKNLTKLKAQNCSLSQEVIPIIEKMKSLKYLDLSLNSSMKDSEREIICGMEIDYIDCGGKNFDEMKETNVEFLDSLSNISIFEPRKSIEILETKN
ncbi:hypothetical protein NAEGRDRAFT_53605 [Naegleria gruberi]|uniref:F-box domain-containing protein n=1 Tax=Naegleria gruberi TaxID=5762 RepID=D2VZW6_NAEGR|nr:uncharacterized protein NAEGRDRAFT_53605 [Naegleria gruberi]EFC37601.1 hypothetical protein NAEGRDRAFT_53605 [Naegleria gruberi]|eukprot:XP_002670345.1 hypothetical protein NAEGRDRAFT_53605 [Naegleria gruberi strain NEG-M]